MTFMTLFFFIFSILYTIYLILAKYYDSKHDEIPFTWIETETNQVFEHDIIGCDACDIFTYGIHDDFRRYIKIVKHPYDTIGFELQVFNQSDDLIFYKELRDKLPIADATQFLKQMGFTAVAKYQLLHNLEEEITNYES